jgi:imidazoleglycerol phosphate synthase cyclase subunit
MVLHWLLKNHISFRGPQAPPPSPAKAAGASALSGRIMITSSVSPGCKPRISKPLSFAILPVTEILGAFAPVLTSVLVDGDWYVYLNGGRIKTDLKTLDWAKRGVELGVGEILLTSMKHDGTKDGFAIEITRAISESVKTPVIASGGAGTMQHFTEIFDEGKADAALAASIFHYREINIPELKKFLKENGIEVRL